MHKIHAIRYVGNAICFSYKNIMKPRTAFFDKEYINDMLYELNNSDTEEKYLSILSYHGYKNFIKEENIK